MNKSDMEYSALLEEYKCLKSEIAANLASSRQGTNLTLLALGLLAGAAKELAASDGYWPLLLGPPVFVALMLGQLRYTYLAVEMGAYIDRKLARKIRTLANTNDVMGWESFHLEMFRSTLWLPVRGATLLLPLLGAILCLVLYWGIHVQGAGSMSFWPPDRLSSFGFLELSFITGAAIYCFVAGRRLTALETTTHETPPDNQPTQPTGSVGG